MAKWSILILTQPCRQLYLRRLLDCLEPQVADHPEIEIVIRQYDRNMNIGRNRQAMIDASTAEYVNFVDDDDMVPKDYVEKIIPLLDGVDYIGFRVQLYFEGATQKPTIHSLRFGKWYEDEIFYYRDISHLNPIRRDLALKVPFTAPGGEDVAWADSMRTTGLVRTEHFVDRVMYQYFYRRDRKQNGQGLEIVF